MTLKRMDFRYCISSIITHSMWSSSQKAPVIFPGSWRNRHETDESCICVIFHQSSFQFAHFQVTQPVEVWIWFIWNVRISVDLFLAVPKIVEVCRFVVGERWEPSKGVDQWWNCWFVKSCNRNGCSVITVCIQDVPVQSCILYWNVLVYCPSTVSSHIFTCW